MPVLETREAPRTVHLFPNDSGWVLFPGEHGEAGRHFPDLGLALDAATRGPRLVHVVVHERATAA